jgi:hypothetical protein
VIGDPHWHGSAFGLHLSGSFPAPGLAGGGAIQEDITHLTLTSREELGSTAPSELLYDQPLPAGRLSIGWDSRRGYVVDHSYYGCFVVREDGLEVVCAPDELPDWAWQRFLVGQVLPLAALVRGYEPLHASAVAVGSQAVLLMGTSGAGKSSVALHMVAAGAALHADDVSVLELRDSVVCAHPGPALASVDEAELATLPLQLTSTWTQLGKSEGEVRLVVGEASRRALPVDGVYVLTRRAEATVLDICPTSVEWPEVLLGGTFNAYVRRPERLIRQLDIAVRLAETVPLCEVEIPPTAGASTVAAAILRALDGISPGR